MPVLLAVRVLVLTGLAVVGIPVGTFPAGGLAPHCASGVDPIVQGRQANASSRLVLPERPVHCVQKSEALGDPVLQIGLVGLEGLRSADVDRVEIHRWVLVGDPVGECPTDTACRLDSDRVETGGDIAVVDLGSLSHVVDAIGSERLGAVEEQLKADLAQDRHSVDRSLEDRPDMIPVLGQRAEAEITGDLVHTPDLAPRFEEAGHDLPGLLLEVRVVARVAQSRCADLHSSIGSVTM